MQLKTDSQPQQPADELLDLNAWLDTQKHSLCALTRAQLPAVRRTEISTDTRQLKAGALYIPLRGEKFDGHHFLKRAYEQGAALLLCEESYFEQHPQDLAELPLICVPDTLRAYQSLARFWRRQWGRPVIAITGSSGKTSTKEILAQVLSPFYRVHRTEANFNNEIGVPKTLLSLPADSDVCIVEMGMRGLGQIAELCEIAEPSHGIITNIGPVHIGELGSQENVAQAKWELAQALAADGVLALNHDNRWLAQLSQEFTGKLISCGRTGKLRLEHCAPLADHTGQDIHYVLPGETQTRTLQLDLEGEHQALNLLCCLGILSALGHSLPEGHRIEVPRLFGRQQERNIQGITLIHDAYNANPDSMKAAIDVLARRPGRRIAVLGLMGELGPEAEKFHREVGAHCEAAQLDRVYAVGAEAQAILEGLNQVEAQGFESKADAITALTQAFQAGDVVLFKASRSAGLEEVIDTVATQLAQLAP